MRAVGAIIWLPLLTAASVAQSVNYKSYDATSGVATRLDFYATARKDCSPSPPPPIVVVTPPKHGLLTIRRGTVKSTRIAECPNFQTDANVVFYTPGRGYAGEDEVVYEVRDSKGAVSLYNLKITVKENKAPPPGNLEQKL